MTIPKVFIASSSEALGIVDTVHGSLTRALSGTASVTPWPGTFKLTKTYIESLEKLLETSDFAVLVLTPDDETTSRTVEKRSPRDNVIFEMGLFFGRLGRERCFLIQPQDLDLKLPSDLLGVEPATFSLSPTQNPEAALDAACSQIASAIQEAMTTLPSRPRLDNSEREAQGNMRKFYDRIKGMWWERIQVKEREGDVWRLKGNALSFFSITSDEVYNSVRLDGKAYSKEGHRADWRGRGVRLKDQTIFYVRECQRLDVRTAAWLPGLAEVNFDDDGGAIKTGRGKFWESDESQPEATIIKFVDLRRADDQNDALTMTGGSTGDKQSLVERVLDNW